MATVESKVGPQTLSDGTLTQARLGKSGEINVSDTHARFYEPNYRGGLFTCFTAIAGVDPQGAAALSSTLALAVRNPTGSGVNAVLHKFLASLVSFTTLELGCFVYGVYPQGSAALGGTALTVVSGNIGSSATAKCTAGTGASVTAGSPTNIRTSGITLAAVGTAANELFSQAIDNIDGDLIVPPGFAWTVHLNGTAGTSVKMNLSAVWEEVAI